MSSYGGQTPPARRPSQPRYAASPSRDESDAGAGYSTGGRRRSSVYNSSTTTGGIQRGPASLHPDAVNQRRRSSSQDSRDGFYTPRSLSATPCSSPFGPRRTSSVRHYEGNLSVREQAAVQAGATQEMIKDYVGALIEQHTSAAASWDRRVRVAETYRNKQLRVGGEASGPRGEDRGALEKIDSAIEHYLRHVEEAENLLARQQDAAEGLRDPTSRDWHGYCVRFYAVLHDIWLEASVIQRRARRVLDVPLARDPYAPPQQLQLGGVADRAATPTRGRATSKDGHRPSSRRSSAAPGQPAVTPIRRSSTPAGSTALVDPNSPLGKMQLHRAPSVRPATQSSGGSVRRGSEATAVRPGAGGLLAGVPAQRRSIYAELRPITGPSGRPLHPDTTVPEAQVGTPYDEGTVYGRLSPYRFDPLRAAPVVQAPEPTAAMVLGTPFAQLRQNEVREVVPDGGARSRSRGADAALVDDKGDDAPAEVSNALVARRSTAAAAAEMLPEVKTYLSPRGRSESAVPEPELPPARRVELLEMIEAYTKNAARLNKDHLRQARECFVELYGHQRGIRQYCDWIDEMALQALRRPST